MSFPEIVAHRGLAAVQPENTLAAFAAALAAGLRHLECDVLLSKEGLPVVFHDRELRRLCGVDGRVHERELSQLRRLSVRGEPIPALEELVQLVRRHPGATLHVEAKRQAMEAHGRERVLEAIERAVAPLATRASLISFDLEFLALARARTRRRIGAVCATHEEAPALARLAPDYIFADLAGLPPAGHLGVPGADLVVYEVDDARTARDLHRRGARMVESFDAARLARELRGA
jgi:glycerophosphoryl diester phosphodiesterase